MQCLELLKNRRKKRRRKAKENFILNFAFFYSSFLSNQASKVINKQFFFFSQIKRIVKFPGGKNWSLRRPKSDVRKPFKLALSYWSISNHADRPTNLYNRRSKHTSTAHNSRHLYPLRLNPAIYRSLSHPFSTRTLHTSSPA